MKSEIKFIKLKGKKQRFKVICLTPLQVCFGYIDIHAEGDDYTFTFAPEEVYIYAHELTAIATELQRLNNELRSN